MKKLFIFLPIIGSLYYFFYYKKKYGDIFSQEDKLKDEKDLILFFYQCYCYFILFWFLSL